MVEKKMVGSRVDMVVVGEPQCGKTSLITTLVSSIFPESVPSVLQQVRIPPEETSDNIALSITDTSSSPEDRQLTMQQVAQANVVILVYNAVDVDGLAKIARNWLPEITKVSSSPIILVANKTDLIPKHTEQRVEAEKLMKEFHQIDACWNCSGKLNMNVAEVFAVAQQAVVHPVAPLFDTQRLKLRQEFITALARIFRIFDKDHDGILSDSELNDFQATCFGARLQASDIEDVRAMLASEGSDRVTESGITLNGFLGIHQKFIQRNRAETAWLVLRQFGYDQSLQLKIPLSIFSFDAKYYRDVSFELTKSAQIFLTDIFHQFDQDNDQALNGKELDHLFSVCPRGLSPWSACSEPISTFAEEPSSDEKYCSFADLLNRAELGPRDTVLSDVSDENLVKQGGVLNLAGWLGAWSMLTLLRPKITLAYFYFLGFDMTTPAVHLTRRRAIENENNNLQRQVIRGFVFGAHGVGKSSLLRVLANSFDVHKKTATEQQRGKFEDDDGKMSYSGVSAVGRVKRGDGTTKAGHYFVLTEVASELFSVEEAFSSGMVDCDVAILVFDSSNRSSLDWLVNIQKRIPETVPCVYLDSKSGDADTMETWSAALDLCKSNNLSDPESVALPPVSPKDLHRVNRTLELCVTVALHPDAARPISEEKRWIQRRNRALRASLRISLVASLAGASLWLLWSLFGKSGSRTSSNDSNQSRASGYVPERKYI